MKEKKKNEQTSSKIEIIRLLHKSAWNSERSSDRSGEQFFRREPDLHDLGGEAGAAQLKLGLQFEHPQFPGD